MPIYSIIIFLYLTLPNLTFAQKSNLYKQNTANRYPIIPYPVELVPQKGEFEINKETTIQIENEEIKRVADFFRDDIKKNFGYILEYRKVAENENVITFSYDTTISHQEGYSLEITNNQIKINFKSLHGAYYAVQTFRQLLPCEQAINQNDRLTVPSVKIIDYPLLSYRGYMLDVARYFYPIEFIKKMMDAMTFYKLNVFHLHLNDDQGWRFESKKYPRLQEVGAWRSETQNGHRTDKPLTFDGKKHGGFYTQEELKDIVKYAEERFIRVIPEIDIPGHSQAILTAYPQLGCIDSTYTVSTVWGIHNNILCPTEETFKFLEDIFDEVISIFPDKNIHIGGDEVTKKRWEESAFCQELIKKLDLKDEHGLQSYFIKRVENYLNSKGREIIGWDEILEGGLAKGATVMSWRGEKGGIKAAEMSHPVVMAPNQSMYFNYYNTKHKMKLEPLANTAVLPLKKVYDYCPFPEQLTESQYIYIIGLQACLWTEYCKTPEQAESLTFPRLCAMSEVAWTQQDLRDYDDFYKRLIINVQHLKKMKINYSTLFLDIKNNEY